MGVIMFFLQLTIALTSPFIVISYRSIRNTNSGDILKNNKLADFNNSNFRTPSHCLSCHKSSHQHLESQPTIVAIQNEKLKKTLLSICMSATYASIIISVMTYPPCMSLLKNQYPVTSTLFNYKTLFAAGTIITMVGKFTLGPPTDEFGGEFTMKLTMLIMAISLFLFSITTSFAQFAPLWILISYVYASAWGAIGKIVRENYPSNEWGSSLGLVAATSRLGSFLSALLFGYILKPKAVVSVTAAATPDSWRNVFRVGSAIQFSILLAYTLIDKYFLSKAVTSNSTSRSHTVRVEPIDSIKAASPNVDSITLNDSENVSQVLKRVSMYPPFWLMLTAKMNLLMVGQFISFIPIYLSSAPSIMLPPEISAKASSTFALGSLGSCVLGFKLYDKLSQRAKMLVVTLLNVVASIIPFALCIPGVAQPSSITKVLCLWGMCWAFPLYIPPGVYVLSLSRPHAALLTNIYDAAGFTLAGVFSYFAMHSGETGHWNPTLMTLAIGTSIASVCMFLAMLLSSSNETSKKE